MAFMFEEDDRPAIQDLSFIHPTSGGDSKDEYSLGYFDRSTICIICDSPLWIEGRCITCPNCGWSKCEL